MLFLQLNPLQYMKKLSYFLTTLGLISLILPSAASAAAYMKLGDIKGEAIDRSNSTEIQSVRWMSPESVNKKQSARSPQGNGGSFLVTKRIDKSSPLLAKMLSSGGEFGEMAIADRGKNFLLKKVKVVSIQKKGNKRW